MPAPSSFYLNMFLTGGLKIDWKRNRVVTIYSPSRAAHVYIKCAHNLKPRTITVNRGWNSICGCHINESCSVTLWVDKRWSRDTLAELPQKEGERKVYLIQEGDHSNSITKPGKLEELCMGAMYRYSGKSVISDPQMVPRGIAQQVDETTFCAMPYCIFTATTICTKRCSIRDHLCDLEASKPYPPQSNIFSWYSTNSQIFPDVRCGHRYMAHNVHNM